MKRVSAAHGVAVFIGNIDDPDAEVAAALHAASCGAFARDDDDECYATPSRNCFNCRARRWVPDGFTCTKGLL